MNLFLPSDPRPLHFVGIGGAGMSALAADRLEARLGGERVRPGHLGLRSILVPQGARGIHGTRRVNSRQTPARWW